MTSKTISTISGLCLLLVLSSCSPIRNSMQEEWKVSHGKNDEVHQALTQIEPVSGSEVVCLLNPRGVEVYQQSDGRALNKVEDKKRSLKIPDFGKKSKLEGVALQVEKVVYLRLPQTDYMLEFDYRLASEKISMIDMKTNAVLWANEELTWSLERIQELVSLVSKATTKDLGVRNAAGAAAGIFFPEQFIKEMVTYLDQKNILLIKDLKDLKRGLSAIDLSNGKVLWRLEVGKNIAALHFDETQDQVVVYGGNPPIMQGLGHLVQLNKDLIRIDVNTGNVVWKTEYSKNFITKIDGGFGDIQTDRIPDIRKVDKYLISNFNQLEVHDYETGEAIFETSTGKDALMNWTNYGPNVLFPFPVVEEGVVYRTVINRILAFNQTFIVEAYEMESGNLLWATEELTKKPAVNMSIVGNKLLIGYGSKDGVIAIDKTTGKKLWQTNLSRKANSAKWIIEGERIYLSDKKEILVLNTNSGEITNRIEVGKQAGKVKEMFLHEGKMIVLGVKKGVARVNLKTMQVEIYHKLKFNAELSHEGDRFVIFGLEPSNPIVFLDAHSFQMLASLKKSKKRYALSWDAENDKIYTARKGRLTKYGTN